MQAYVLMLHTDPDDQLITESALTDTNTMIPVKYIQDPLMLENRISEWGRPALILLNDAGALYNGTELLKELKSNPRYADIPVVVLGEISSPDYVRECYRAGANSFITKPSTILATRKKIDTFFRYWFEVAEV
jgi:PleD family two-component response regulator